MTKGPQSRPEIDCQDQRYLVETKGPEVFCHDQRSSIQTRGLYTRLKVQSSGQMLTLWAKVLKSRPEYQNECKMSTIRTKDL